MDPIKVEIELYRQGMEALEASGIFRFIEQFGVVADQGIHPEMVQANFSEARRSYGFNQAVSYLRYFQQIFLAPDKKNVPMPMSYGALESMLKTGTITKEKYDSLAAKPIFNPGR